MINVIRIKKASFYAYHGVFREEQKVGGKFEADIELYTDFRNAASKDDLRQTVDYEKVYRILHDIAMREKFFLLESLANRIVQELFADFPSVSRIIVRVRKNNPPIGGVVDSVEIEVGKDRSELESTSQEANKA